MAAEKQAKEAKSAEAPAPKKKRRWPLLFALLALLAGGGGGAAWHFMGAQADAAPAPAPAKPLAPVFVPLERPDWRLDHDRLREAGLDPARWRAVVETCHKRLYTPVGLRSLSRDHRDYKPKYYGDLRSRDAAYHQGTIWAWLIGPFIDSWLKVHPNQPAGARQFLAGFEAGARATNGGVRLLTAYAAEWPKVDGFVDLDQNEALAEMRNVDDRFAAAVCRPPHEMAPQEPLAAGPDRVAGGLAGRPRQRFDGPLQRGVDRRALLVGEGLERAHTHRNPGPRRAVSAAAAGASST